MNNEPAWEASAHNAAREFGQRCRDLHRTNPYGHIALDELMTTLMTELWDHNFSQSEIRSAFDKALADMPRYAAGLERRGDGPY